MLLSPFRAASPMPSSAPLATLRQHIANPSACETDQRRLPPRVSCIVPCWNEAGNLMQLLPQLMATLVGHTTEWEVVLVDDGSSDGTAALLASWARLPGFRVMQLSRNFGKEAALSAGLAAARGDVVVSMDADMQHSPSLIPTLLHHWHRGADVVVATRDNRRDEGLLKRLGARGFYVLVNVAGRVKVPADAGDFRLMDRRVVDALLRLPERNRFMKGLYAWVGFDVVRVPYTPEPRACGRSRFGMWRLSRLSIDGLTAFTTWPLRAVSIGGCLLALLGFCYGAYLTASYLIHGHALSGWTTIVVSLLLLSGIQLIAIGIAGEYIGRIFEEVKARPLYIVKRELGQGLRPRSNP